METVKQLPKGIPQGYKPQRQRAPESATVLMSEWARKAAHELNDRHHNWIEARVKDKFADENLSEAQLRDAIDHTALFLKWDLVEEYVPKVERDHSMIYAYIGYLNKTKGYVGRHKVSRQQWAAHVLAQKEELAYKVCLLRYLKQRRSQFRRIANEFKYKSTDSIKSDLDVAGVVHSVLKAVLARESQLTLTDDEKSAIERVGQYIKGRTEEMLRRGERLPEDYKEWLSDQAGDWL